MNWNGSGAFRRISSSAICLILWAGCYWPDAAQSQSAIEKARSNLMMPRLQLSTEIRPQTSGEPAVGRLADNQRTTVHTLPDLKIDEDLNDTGANNSISWRFFPPPGELNRFGISRAERLNWKNGVPVLEAARGEAEKQ